MSATMLALWGAVMEAQAAIETVTKSKTAKVQTKGGSSYEYKFTSTEDLMQAARTALLGAGVLAQRVSYEVHAGPAGPEVHSVFRLVHPQSGEVEMFPALAMPISSHNAADKALAGALTYAWAYWLRDVLAIPREDDNEPDKRKTDDGAARYRREQPRPTERTVTRPDPQPQKPQPPAEEDVSDLRKRLSDISKEYLEACKQAGEIPDVYGIAGKAIGVDKWTPKGRTRDDYAKAIAAVVTVAGRIKADLAVKPSYQCPVCDALNGAHRDGCPEAVPWSDPPSDGGQQEIGGVE